MAEMSTPEEEPISKKHPAEARGSMQYDDVYEYVGQFGVYQLCVTAAIFAFTLFSLDSVTMIFVGADMDHWCLVPELANLSHDTQKYIAIPGVNARLSSANGRSARFNQIDPYSAEPADFVDAEDSYSSCLMYDLSYDNYSYDDLLTWNRTAMIDMSTPVVSCTQSKWVFDQSTFVSTVVSRFNLVCGSENLNPLVSTLFNVGGLIGSVSAGALADRIGRRSSMLVFLSIKTIGILMCILCPVYGCFAAGRFVLGIGSPACFITTYVLLLELVGPRYRSAAGCGMQISISVGFMLLPLIAMSVRDDIKYQIATMAPNVVVFAYILIVPESPRWLIVRGKYQSAENVFRNMSEVNGKSLPDAFDVRNIEVDDEDKGSYWLLLRFPTMRLRTIFLNSIWFSCGLVYFALALNVGHLAGDIFVNTLVSASIEVPALILCIFLLDWKLLGRKWTVVGAFCTGAVCLVLCIPMSLLAYHTAVTVLNIIGRAAVLTAYSDIYVFSSELFPTEVRNIAMGTAQMFANLGAVVAPYIGESLAVYWVPLPYIILGVIATMAGFLCIFLPETLGQPLMDTVQEAERLNKKRLNANAITPLPDITPEADLSKSQSTSSSISAEPTDPEIAVEAAAAATGKAASTTTIAAEAAAAEAAAAEA